MAIRAKFDKDMHSALCSGGGTFVALGGQGPAEGEDALGGQGPAEGEEALVVGPALQTPTW